MDGPDQLKRKNGRFNIIKVNGQAFWTAQKGRKWTVLEEFPTQTQNHSIFYDFRVLTFDYSHFDPEFLFIASKVYK